MPILLRRMHALAMLACLLSSNMYCRTQSIIPYADERLEKCV